jgi:type II secretory pathway pseudopilin PulG
MRKTRSNSRRRNSESGYTLLIALLIVATILLITAAAAPNIFTEGRRDRDEEMIWRGQQYTRAIGLYYKKYGHYPHTIDDLTKSDTQIRFLRKAYKDPMNTDDGSWRLIYVGPGGALINSVMYTNIAQVGLPPGSFAPPGTGLGDQDNSSGEQTSPGAPPGTASGPAPGATPGATGAGTTPGAAGAGAMAEAADAGDESSLQGDVIGGNLVGVGSKVKKPSIKVYNGGTTYYEWEFIWKPQQGLQGAGATPTPGAVGAASGPSGTSSAPTNSPAPGGTTPDQSQQPSPSPGP